MRGVPFEQYKLTLTPVTPLHIGSGIAVEPNEYKLFREDEIAFLVMLNLDSLISSFQGDAKRQFEKHLNSGDFVALRNFMSDIADPKVHGLYGVEVHDEAFATLEDIAKKSDRKGEIGLFMRNSPTGFPYIPGASIKGAIRTALLNKWANMHDNQKGLTNFAGSRENDRSSAKFEGMVMGNYRVDSNRPWENRPKLDILGDPFYRLAIPDMPMASDSTYISRVEVVRSKSSTSRRQADDTSGILIFREVTVSLTDDYDDDYSCIVRLSNTPEADRKRNTPRQISVEEIIGACNSFFIPNLHGEMAKYNVWSKCASVLNCCVKRVESGEQRCALIRLGRYSHFENITIRFARTPEKGFGKSRTYAGGMIPMGWAMIEFKKI